MFLSSRNTVIVLLLMSSSIYAQGTKNNCLFEAFIGNHITENKVRSCLLSSGAVSDTIFLEESDFRSQLVFFGLNFRDYPSIVETPLDTGSVYLFIYIYKSKESYQKSSHFQLQNKSKSKEILDSQKLYSGLSQSDVDSIIAKISSHYGNYSGSRRHNSYVIDMINWSKPGIHVMNTEDFLLLVRDYK